MFGEQQVTDDNETNVTQLGAIIALVTDARETTAKQAELRVLTYQPI